MPHIINALKMLDDTNIHAVLEASASLVSKNKQEMIEFVAEGLQDQAVTPTSYYNEACWVLEQCLITYLHSPNHSKWHFEYSDFDCQLAVNGELVDIATINPETAKELRKQMQMLKFKVHDWVFCPDIGKSYYSLEDSGDENYPLAIFETDANHNKISLLARFTEDGKSQASDVLPKIFFATEENWAKLQNLYGAWFVKPYGPPRCPF
ncbi:hypothetical protein ACFBZI_11595 [Moraxella sp. ZJ142]|uniref:hypothetical protein n=1 Tax=Moraxella marmotae TaxID=3344520 RepID=UPI0035D4E796